MIRYYCTLFDTHYMSRGLAMIESLLQHAPKSRIAVFAFDQQCESILRQLANPQVDIIGLSEFETSELLRVKPSRKHGEYCWTCTPFVIAHCLQKLRWSECTYVDADLFFFSSPEPAFFEAPSANVLITEHRYTPRYDQTKTSGRYCVQFMQFKNTASSLEILRWWGERCLEWCHDYFEDGKFGDQKYLDDWEIRFEGVHSIRHEGIGLAPWNIQQYKIVASQGGIHAVNRREKAIPVIFYHFHALKLLMNDRVDLSTYVLPSSARQYIYRRYLQLLLKWHRRLQQEFHISFAPTPEPKILQKIHRVRAGFPNILSIETI